jgi:hypothetical protein
MALEQRGNAGSEEVALMSKDVTLHLDEFGHRTLARFARGRGATEAALVRTASLYYLSERDAGRPSWRARKFGTREAVPKIRVELDEGTWGALQLEAERQGVSPDTLALHALMFFLADLDSGKIGDRLEESFEDD